MAGGTPRSTSSRPKGGAPEVGPSTPSGVSKPPAQEIDLTVHETSKIELREPVPAQTALPEESPAPEQLPRLGERVSVNGVWRAVNEGYASRAVALVQGALSGAGYDPGPYDGVGGRRTRAALTAFATDRGTELTDMDSLTEALDALGFDI